MPNGEMSQQQVDNTQNIIDDEVDLQDVRAMLDQQPKSKSPPLSRPNVKRIMNDQ
jgi:hypothetical protein